MARLIVSGEVQEVENGCTIGEAVTSIGLHPDSYLYIICGKPVPIDIVLDGDTVKVLPVASGG